MEATLPSNPNHPLHPLNHHLHHRRSFLFHTVLTGATILSIPTTATAATATTATSSDGNLPWEQSPINKRSGVTVFDAEREGYNVRFVTYLSRFLLNFDADCQRWWYSRAADLPRRGTVEQVDAMRLLQFGAFSASVEVGLQEYRGPEGPRLLMANLLRRYGPDADIIAAERDARGLDPATESSLTKQGREIKEARRQIALLMGLMDQRQPVEEITKLLAAIDNGSIDQVEIVDPGSGYAPGYGSPMVVFPPPEAGEEYQRATGRALLKPNGKILRIDLVNRGFGYTKAPIITISPPAAMSEGRKKNSTVCAPMATAILFRSGVNKGRIERIQLTDPGAGYVKDEIIRIKFSPPEMLAADGGTTATAVAVLEYEVAGIQMINAGTGYAVEKPISVYVEAPPLTARVNMNDPMLARIISPDEPLPASTIPSKEMRKKMPKDNDPSSLAARAERDANNDGNGGGGGCIGRACYDRAVRAVAYPRAEMDSYTTFQNPEDTMKAQKVEAAIRKRSSFSASGTSSIMSEDTTYNAKQQKKVVSATSSGPDSSLPTLPIWSGGVSSSTQLLSLLPSGIGLEYDSVLKRYRLGVGDGMPDWTQAASSAKPLDPEFGPRGRSPIERDMELGVATYLRFCASGAICCSAVHLALTPIDVVKTKVQTNPAKYPGVFSSFEKVLKEEGIGTFFTGWAPTFAGFFIWGGFSYTTTELIRRCLIEAAGSEASSLEVPIILAASSVGAFFGSFIISPFEAIRIRTVSQPNFAPNFFGVFNRIVDEEGIRSLFSAVPVFLVKEIPFAMAKFTVFDVSTAWMYETFPAAREDLQLSLLVSLVGGTLGGVTAALVSNPADATISEMKKAATKVGPLDAARIIFERGGPPAFFKGLQLRMFFYSLLVSLQFLVYDTVRFALGIGADDLKLYLDVLGGALGESGGPI